ncbi:MAG: hypothetical protein WC477_05785 [Patescibacteria group bacterium]
MTPETRRERDELVVKSINMLHKYNSTIYTAKSLNDSPSIDQDRKKTIIAILHKFVGEVNSFQKEVLDFMKKNKVDNPIYCDFFLPPMYIWHGNGEPSMNLVLHEDYVDVSMEEIEIVLKRNMEALKKVNDSTFKNKPLEKTETYIESDGDSYQYENRPIRFNEKSIYGRIFEIVFKCCNQGGFVSYEHIEEQLRQQEQRYERLVGKARNARIINALSETQGFLRYAKVDCKKIPTILPNGKELFEIKRGEGVKFNNKK